MKSSDILGMNARNQIYERLNSSQAKSICTSKYATKIVLEDHDIPTAKIYAVFATTEDVHEFDWLKLTENFVIKPTNGHAGKGVVAFRLQKDDYWIDILGKHWSLEDIKLHCFDTLEGQYSTHGTNHNVIVEERVITHHKLRKYSYKGTPDVRVFVFNSVPVMAALRLPTAESEGRANISQGAISVGIDIASGVTTYGMAHKNQFIKYLPDSKRKLSGIQLPFWKQTLLTAVKTAQAVGIVYSGVDLFIDEEKGPMVAEINAYPGLSFQFCNRSGLKRRLQRVESLNVLNADHGVRIGRALFAEIFSDKIKADEGLQILNYQEKIKVKHDDRNDFKEADALFDTGRFRSAIALSLEDLDLVDWDDLLWFQQEGGEGKRPVVEAVLKIKDRKIKTSLIVSKKLDQRKYKVVIGRKDLPGFLIGEK